jgi:hypothetical protein
MIDETAFCESACRSGECDNHSTFSRRNSQHDAEILPEISSCLLNVWYDFSNYARLLLDQCQQIFIQNDKNDAALEKLQPNSHMSSVILPPSLDGVK